VAVASRASLAVDARRKSVAGSARRGEFRA
jgi:hypothetical protein